MERRNSKEWIDSLKIAIINNDLDKLKRYSNRKMPSFSSIEEAKEALNLVNQATNILQQKKEEIGRKLTSIKQQQKYSFINHSVSTTSWKA
jgi:hypothetical protein